MDTFLLVLCAISTLISVIFLVISISILKTLRNYRNDGDMKNISLEIIQQRQNLYAEFQTQRNELNGRIDSIQNRISVIINETLRTSNEVQASQTLKLTHELQNTLNNFGNQVKDMSHTLEARMSELRKTQEERLETIRATMENKISEMQQGNQIKLEEIRQMVDEKLQKTLNERVTESFKIVGERLEQVYKGLGEMQNLASGVGDLKKILANVKTRGTFGEIQLSRILEQLLTKDQYAENVITKPGSRDCVEYAIKLPGKSDSDKPVYLPMDAKFPLDLYTTLLDAYDSADQSIIDQAGKALENTIKKNAKDIRDKYIDPPNTTDFAIMFLPTEGLYAEVTRRTNLLDVIARDYNINIAGPSTVSALLNSLQMGFRTLAIEKRSHEVWILLSAVKTEFSNFEGVLNNVKKRLDLVDTELNKLIGVRTRAVMKKLNDVQTLPIEEAHLIIGDVVLVSEIDDDE